MRRPPCPSDGDQRHGEVAVRIGRDRTVTSVRDKGCELGSPTTLDGRLVGLVTVRNEASHEIDSEVHRTAVPGVFDLYEMLELVKDRFHEGAAT